MRRHESSSRQQVVRLQVTPEYTLAVGVELAHARSAASNSFTK
ncbi:hypothetical protein ACOBV9_02415 [Pseudoalteromonas espejiana]